ncbi:unnamed protein product [Spirodela intermedia]|uniref:Uncharacterized protein n=2 Tax=Spirodela intermedia TaxID=51605 RepID=A0A7I8LLY5_SPIIN|nr:unnamed protein product [Spirodela intermedia]CAA6673396.1 unnamed protein product [Spirodela intermedia]CAA7410626.1 unnamed protein product [Spirodela intermedia]
MTWLNRGIRFNRATLVGRRCFPRGKPPSPSC